MTTTYDTESEYDDRHIIHDGNQDDDYEYDDLDTQNDTLGTTRTGIGTLSGTEIVTANLCHLRLSRSRCPRIVAAWKDGFVIYFDELLMEFI